MNKAQSQERHAAIRGIQRFGAVPDDKRIIAEIQQGKAKVIRRQSHRVIIYLVSVPTIDGFCPAYAVYDKTRKTIVTYLYPTIDAEKTSIDGNIKEFEKRAAADIEDFYHPKTARGKVLLALAQHINKRSGCATNRKVDPLVQYSCLINDKKTAERALDVLEETGLISINE